MSALLADGLLVLSLLFVRPVPDRAWALRLLLHALLLAACLAAAATEGRAGLFLCLAGCAAALLQAVLHALQARRPTPLAPPSRPEPSPRRDALWLLGGLLMVALAVRSIPAAALPAHPHGMLVVSLGILFTGLLGTIAAATAIGRAGALLTVANGLLLSACTLPGAGWLSLGSILLLQGGVVWMLVHAAGPGVLASAAGR
jgi:hydrogenase-4 membrane subunit HyfE